MPNFDVLGSFRLDGRRALVTGGNRGLGEVMATALAQAGADVAVVSRTLADCQAAAQRIANETGRKTAAASADLVSEAAVQQMAREVEEQLGGPVDILINNAGINIRGLSHELSEADFDAVMDTNVKGPFLCSRHFGPAMAQRGWGRVINLGSILSTVALPGRAAYCSSKAAVANLTRVLALEWAAQGVTVNAICPGPFATDMNKQLLDDPEKYKAFVSKIPLGRWGELPEIAGVAVFLASNASSYVTGSLLMVDGGWTAQ